MSRGIRKGNEGHALALEVSSPSGRITTGETVAPPLCRTLPCASAVLRMHASGCPTTGTRTVLAAAPRALMLQCRASAFPGITLIGMCQLANMLPPTITCTTLNFSIYPSKNRPDTSEFLYL